ncbi:leucine-rich repeat-containing protein 34 [Monodelphis domestica]|uniref:leucine-rich repeat-containing protein 34 n=1 Tax=Monodelphis domestica TaxID=13616 RepID=UPI0024E244F1|nr:leucine-rich repeat-containing protein 34 [Monodelphis domestica]XP_056663371.1 leucine-rich repeat-containing protein 34 [Monodelphis domestica]XP_056663372.1 leucine-rich repeat-containing protein 34 [Monodelphis domestica]XP_056663373.1 leucine-rich repeat-containing protein 34 [Monodelphis domestica]XP_056663375.1 leucine-rich repeat-containing protein 34 [Monodelphis domestica]XP_056663376.1 leucine-rich repeat-containing protein 34 [Monodelphis domestica]
MSNSRQVGEGLSRTGGEWETYGPSVGPSVAASVASTTATSFENAAASSLLPALPAAIVAALSVLPADYLEFCSGCDRPPNPFIYEALQQLEKENRTKVGFQNGIIIKLAGNNRVIPMQRLTDDDFEIISYVVKIHRTVTGLDVRYNLITDTGSIYAAQLIEENPTVVYLNLMFNDIKTEGGEIIARALHRNQTLKHLRMTGNKIENKGGMSFATMLQINSSLEKLDLGDCDLGMQSLIAIATVLTKNDSIKGINLNRPILKTEQEESTVHISHMLQRNSTLIELHMSKHDIQNFGMQQLCEALYENTALRYLDVTCNRITRDAMKFLGELLKRNNVLEVIDLSSNRIEDEGSMYVCEALAFYNTSLKVLSIVSNNITGKGLIGFSESMKTNTTLSHIYIWGNKFDKETCEAFSNLIETGRLKQENTDVEPYKVDGCVYLAELSHGIKRHYYWTPTFGEVNSAEANSGYAVVPTAAHL